MGFYVIKELVAEPDFVRSVDSFIKHMLSTYAQPETREAIGIVEGELLTARGALLANCGRYLLKVGQALAQAAKQATAKRQVLAPTERIKIVEVETTGKLSRLEDYFRKELLKRRVYADDTLPAAKFPMPVVTAPSQAQARVPDAANHPCKTEPNSTSGGSAVPTVPHVAAEELTVAHVYERLRVTGCGEDVMVFVNNDLKPVVKQETTDTSSGLVDATVGSQPSAGAGAWRVVKLVNVNLPDAVVELTDDDTIERFKVCVDDLRAFSKANEVKVILHPSLQETGTLLDPYDYDLCQSSFIKEVAEHMLIWAHAAASACVEKVRVSRLSDKGKVPFVLQLRATEAFKKGSLVLAPAYGQLLPKGSDVEHQLARSQVVLHGAMLSHVEVKVFAASGDRRRAAEHRQDQENTAGAPQEHRRRAAETAFVILSPLLAGKAPKDRDGCMENLAPFWALLRCAGPRASHNMELDSVVFRDPGFEAKATPYPHIPKGVGFTVHMPIARNVSHIAKGDVLSLPFLGE